MPIELKTVNSKSLLKQYILLPGIIYAGYDNWVPPVYADEWKFHDPRYNSALKDAEVIKIIAFKDGVAAGRIMGIIHKKYNAMQNQKTARFFNFACVNDSNVCSPLVKYVEQWAKEEGMNKIIGPFGFSDKDPQGLQIEGFEYTPLIATPVNPPYLQQLVEALGYVKEVDCLSFYFEIPETIHPVLQKICERIQANGNLQLRDFATRKQMKPFIKPVFELVNETYTPLLGFVPLTKEEMKRMAARYVPILDPEFVKVVTTNEGKLVAFIVAMPHMSKGLQKAKGKLFPFGFIHILRAMKKTKQLDLLLGAVHPLWRGTGLDVLLWVSMMKSAAERGFVSADSHLVLETNKKMCSEYEKAGGKIYKIYRIYHKLI